MCPTFDEHSMQDLSFQSFRRHAHLRGLRRQCCLVTSLQDMLTHREEYVRHVALYLISVLSRKTNGHHIYYILFVKTNYIFYKYTTKNLLFLLLYTILKLDKYLPSKMHLSIALSYAVSHGTTCSNLTLWDTFYTQTGYTCVV